MGVMPIPCPHFKITIVKRSQGQSAVAGAAYQSGERLFSEYDQRTKFYNKKKELVHAEIMLPSYAPPGYADRATLWNAVEAVENQWNSQLARRIVLAFPVEVPKEQYLSMIKEFCQEQFVSKGMIADFAIHDKGDGNPHAHILLTLRAIDEHGKWLPKARKVYDLDENGERIRLASGNWKCHKENTVDWNDQKYAEVWRHSWEVVTNRYLEAAGRPERVDLRSFERQGILAFGETHCQLITHLVGFLGGDLAGFERLPDLIGNHVTFLSAPSDKFILPFGQHKFFIHRQRTAFVTTDQFALLCLVGILYIVCTAFQTGRNRLAFVFVQRDQPCCGHPKSPP